MLAASSVTALGIANAAISPVNVQINGGPLVQPVVENASLDAEVLPVEQPALGEADASARDFENARGVVALEPVVQASQHFLKHR